MKQGCNTNGNNNIWQEEMTAKPGMSKTSQSPSKENPSKVIQPIETKNCYWSLETEENPTKNGNVTIDSLNEKATVKKKKKKKKKALNTANQNTQKLQQKRWKRYTSQGEDSSYCCTWCLYVSEN